MMYKAFYLTASVKFLNHTLCKYVDMICFKHFFCGKKQQLKNLLMHNQELKFKKNYAKIYISDSDFVW